MNALNTVKNPTVYVNRISHTFIEPVIADILKDKLSSFLLGLTAFLEKEGCVLIGHIKGMINEKEMGHIFFSITSFDDIIQLKGEPSEKTKEIDMVINIIVYGIDKMKIEKGFQENFRKYFESY